ncbi:hypothetical protein EFY79_16155 [Hanamia caeni]|jgi:hypothetical protein|uniref:Uncharacterized protein n=1 Tax=Hanamia caeni TaxID=2294116 RepID=A0A3M9N8U6_9BACT|nr:hypothetical protein EFY79_16155 [Hanamia caeni]
MDLHFRRGAEMASTAILSEQINKRIFYFGCSSLIRNCDSDILFKINFTNLLKLKIYVQRFIINFNTSF